MFIKRRLPSFQQCLGKHYKVFLAARGPWLGIQRLVSYSRVFWSAACKKWMILQLLNKMSGKYEPRKLFPKTSFVRRIYNLIDSGWDIDGIFSIYIVWADIATGSMISLWDPDYYYGLWADETTFAYVCIHEIENKSLWKEAMSYGGGSTWYMDSTLEEIKNYACIWLISICIIN